MRTRQGRRIALVVVVLVVSLAGLAAAGHVFSQGGMGPGMMGPGYMDPEARGRGGWGHMGPGGMMMGPGMGGGMMGGAPMHPGMMGPGGMGPGMMGPGGMGPGGMGLLNPWLAERLELTDDQREQIDTLEEGLLEKQFAMMRAMHAQRPGMWNSDPAEKVDVDAVMASREAMMSAGREVMRARLQAWNDVLDLLTDEQRAELRALANR